MNIAENIKRFKEEIPADISLVAVSKTKPVEDILTAYTTGHRIFGENKVQELTAKQPELPEDIEWHMIGHLQSNKVKYIAPFVSLIHGVDKFKLLKVINKEARKNDRVIDCLLQFHIAREETKFGLSFEEAKELLESDAYKEMEHVNLVGVMGMATFTEDDDKVREEFKTLKTIFDKLKSAYFQQEDAFRIISMGMSNDYKIAIEEGANMIRVGSLLFGPRNV